MNTLLPTRDEFLGYLRDLSTQGIRGKVSILSPTRNVVYYAVFRGEDVQELVEYHSHNNSVGWNEQVDEVDRYGWIPEFWRFDNGSRPPRQHLETLKFVDYYKEGDILDVDTLHAIALRRGSEPRRDYALQYVLRTIELVYERVKAFSDPKGVRKWPSLATVAEWPGEWSAPENSVLPPLDTALLIRIWAEGYDPLEADVRKGTIPTEEQRTWEAREGYGEDHDYVEETKETLLYHSVLALRGVYLRYTGVPRC